MRQQQNLFKPIKTKKAFEEVSEAVKTLIFKGILKSGDRLPSEVELARQFNVGRQTVREALRILELSGFLAIHRGTSGGPVVSNTISDAINSLFLDAIRMKTITIDDLTVARLEVERIVLKHAINNADDSDIERLQENILKAKRKVESNLQAFSENVQFHRLLANASKNQVLVLVVESIMAVVADFISRLEPDLEKSKQVVKSHEDILNAIIRGESDEAVTLLEKHLLEVESWL